MMLISSLQKIKKFLAILILILTFQASSQADDISDFEIEGMSLGDSALNFFSESDIKKNSKNHYRDKKFTPVQNNNYSFFKTYDAVDFNFKTGDKNYILHNINGILFYDNNIQDCYLKMDQIIEYVETNINYIKKFDKHTVKHSADKTGKSKFTEAYFKLNDGYIVITCYDYSKKHGSQDHLAVSVDTKEFSKWASGGIY